MEISHYGFPDFISQENRSVCLNVRSFLQITVTNVYTLQTFCVKFCCKYHYIILWCRSHLLDIYTSSYTINSLCDYVLYKLLLVLNGGPGSSVGIATGYRLDGPGIESQLVRDFPRLSRLALGPNLPPVQWVPGVSRGKVRPGRAADHSLPSSVEVMEE
jgi:hypothetical protein